MAKEYLLQLKSPYTGTLKPIKTFIKKNGEHYMSFKNKGERIEKRIPDKINPTIITLPLPLPPPLNIIKKDLTVYIMARDKLIHWRAGKKTFVPKEEGSIPPMLLKNLIRWGAIESILEGLKQKEPNKKLWLYLGVAVLVLIMLVAGYLVFTNIGGFLQSIGFSGVF